MIEVSVNDRAVAPTRLRLEDGLNRFPRCEVSWAGNCDPPKVRTPVRLALDAGEYLLYVADFGLEPDGGSGWAVVTSSHGLAKPFDGDIFSGPGGSSFRQAIASRGAANGLPSLAGNFPAVVIDTPLAELLDDVCAREQGWSWWVNDKSEVEVGPPPGVVRKTDGFVTARRPCGVVAEITGPLPRAGEGVRLPTGEEGLLLSLRVEWEAGGPVRAEAFIGPLPTARRHRPTGMIRRAATVKQLEPFLVEVRDDEDPGRTWIAQAQLMGRHTDRGRFQEAVPVAAGDELVVDVPTGGVSVGPLRAYLWRPVRPAEKYHVRAASKKESVAESWSLEADRISETASRKETVVSRYDINRR
jgi:hypothetical protein